MVAKDLVMFSQYIYLTVNYFMWLSVRVCDLLDFIWKMFFLDDFTIKWFGVECASHARLYCIRTDTASMYIFGAGLHYISHIYTLTTPTTRKIFPVVQKCGCVCFSIVVFCSSFAPNWYVFNEIYTNLSIQSRELLAIISSGKIALDSIFSLSLFSLSPFVCYTKCYISCIVRRYNRK